MQGSASPQCATERRRRTTLPEGFIDYGNNHALPASDLPVGYLLTKSAIRQRSWPVYPLSAYCLGNTNLNPRWFRTTPSVRIFSRSGPSVSVAPSVYLRMLMKTKRSAGFVE